MATTDSHRTRAAHAVAPRRAAEEALDVLRRLPDAVFRCERWPDGRMHFTLMEGRLAKELGFSEEEEIRSRPLDELFPEPDHPVLDGLERAFAGAAREFVDERSGRLLRYRPQVVRDASDRVVAVVGSIQEETETRRAEAVIQELNDEMARRLVQLDAANKELETFGYSISHDLRTPLTVLDNNVQLMQQRGAAIGPDEMATRLARMHAASQRMANLIEDLLALSRSTRQPLRPQRVDLTALAQAVVGDLRADQPDRQVEVRLARGLAAQGDPGLLRIVLENLLRNAWKFTMTRSRAHIEVGAEASGFYVRDDGIGFDPADAGRLFETFVRLPSAQGLPGSGIGLATVRRIVERHGGRVWADAAPDHGATFHFTLPAAEAHA